MEFDAAVALRMRRNARLRNAQGWAEYHDLGDALALTSDAPIANLNCICDFHARERTLDSLLDIGFALLRAFDREPAVEVTPLDRPATLRRHLRRRRMRVDRRMSWMVFRGDASTIAANPQVRVIRAAGDDVRTFADIHAGRERWVRPLSLASTAAGMHEPGNAYYLGLVGGTPVATLHLLVDGATAGIYALGTMRAYRRRRVATTMLARAIFDAQAAGCDVVGLSTDKGSDAERLYGAIGFGRAFESELWVG